MKTQRILALITRILGSCTLLALIFAHVALTDIFHNNEPDLQAEWWVVRLAFGVMIMFIISVFVTLKTTPLSIKR